MPVNEWSMPVNEREVTRMNNLFNDSTPRTTNNNGIVPDQQRALWASNRVVHQVPVQHKGEDGVDTTKVVVVVVHQTLLFHHFDSGVQDVGFRLKLVTQLQTVAPGVVAKTHGKDRVDDWGGAGDWGDAVAGLQKGRRMVQRGWCRGGGEERVGAECG